MLTHDRIVDAIKKAAREFPLTLIEKEQTRGNTNVVHDSV